MKPFIPEVAYINKNALKYEEGKRALEFFKKNNVEIIESSRVKINEDSNLRNYVKSKKTVLLTVNRQNKLTACKPSADYQFHLSSSCPGHCEYCYLQTTQGEKPYMKIYSNIDEIIETIDKYIKSNEQISTFEAASITDPVGLDHITGGLKKVIEYFSTQDNGRLRLVTKFDHVDPYLNINHNNHTKFRFSINTDWVINNFEHKTSSRDERIEAAKKLAEVGYPLGFIVAPIILYENWEKDYKDMFYKLKEAIYDYDKDITFELIQHRFTNKAKDLIVERFPNTKLDLNEENRKLKWGPYGQFKHVYKKEAESHIKKYMTSTIEELFPNSTIEYFT
ncbi:spore photoproduct lyase [Clostridium sp. D2Q-11]|uniref:Spore photoproduct lyase n=1 Tax=Anaeromonas frigoriresistens TaxID=2683708 RepID=A0A942Z9P2_9FIRM|nr:spore photoproduct lyase [Anaeromonas frigoriresistens]MBS4539045.1 spore photoproduct lyase [Anaeromonas frigoriresistens]